MTDHLSIVRCHDSRVLAKRIKGTPEGYEVQAYDEAKTYAWHQMPVESLEDVQLALEQLSRDPHACVIRGEPRAHVGHGELVSRRQHPDVNGVRGDWDHHHEGRQWVAFDIDGFRQDAFNGTQPTEQDLKAIVYQARAETLPPEFNKAACVYRFSSSSGLKGWQSVSLHLWFWLDRRIHDLSWRQWAKDWRVDPALFKAVQPHYTADPLFEQFADPLPGLRVGRIPGKPVVETPAALIGGEAWREADRKRVEASKKDLDKQRRAIMAELPQSRTGTRAYALKALEGMCGDLLAAGEGMRHGELVRVAFSLGGYVQPGFLDQTEIVQALTRTVEVVFEARRHADELRTMREMVEAGAKQPHELGHIARKSGQRHLSVVPGGAVGNAALKAPEPPGDDEEGGRQPAGMMLQGVRDNGTAPMSSDNLRELLRFYGIKVQWNEMAKEGEVTIPLQVSRTEMRENTKVGRIRELARQHGMPGGQAFEDAMLMMEDEGAYHPARDWVLSKPWDGVERFEALWRTVVVREDKRAAWGDLYREQLYRWCIGAAKLATLPKLARVTGQQVAQQGVLVLQGPQGKGKTEWFKALAPAGLVSTGVTVDPSNKDDVIKATSTWITELGEIDSTVRKADVGHLKAFLTSASDTYRRAYARVQETYLRRTSFGASVNPEAFLRDTTGNRRFWVVPIERMLAFRDDPDGLPHLDMQQLWAQMAVHAQRGEPHYLGPEFTRAQEAAAEEHRQRDPLEDEVLNAFVIDPDMPKAGWLTTEEVYRTLQPERPLDKWTHGDKLAVARVLLQLNAHFYRSAVARKWSLRRR
jgi:putative DNA primase/helicase